MDRALRKSVPAGLSPDEALLPRGGFPAGSRHLSLPLGGKTTPRGFAFSTIASKPAGVSGCEIWEKIGSPAPTDISRLAYLGASTRTPSLAQFTGAQAGQTAFYWLRWVNTRNEKGAWSEPVSATIAG